MLTITTLYNRYLTWINIECISALLLLADWSQLTLWTRTNKDAYINSNQAVQMVRKGSGREK